MIIKLNGADFSADNIGQIDMPKELHPFTKKIFSVCTRFSMYSDVAQSVNNFILALEEHEVLEHLGLFLAPWLSANKDECLYDFANDVQLSSPNFDYNGNGILSPSSAGAFINLQSSVPTVNFFGFIADIESYEDRDFGTPTFRGSDIFVGRGTKAGTYVGKVVDFNKNNGYGVVYSVHPSPNLLFNIKELSNLDSNSTINSIGVSVSGSYDKAGEPFGSSITKVTPAYYKDSVIGVQRVIIFAGDGTTLNTSQETAILSAMNTLKSKITEL